jgi:hypothetical protein
MCFVGHPLRDQDPRLEIPRPIRKLTFAPDSRHLLTENGNGTVYVLRLGGSTASGSP